jgi:hypothetical protein
MSCSKRTRLKRYATDSTQGLVRPRLKVNALNVVEPTTRQQPARAGGDTTKHAKGESR